MQCGTNVLLKEHLFCPEHSLRSAPSVISFQLEKADFLINKALYHCCFLHFLYSKASLGPADKRF